MSIGSTGASDWETSRTQPARTAYSVREVAEQLGVCQATIWRALRRGELEGILFGGRRLITARSVEKLVAPKG